MNVYRLRLACLISSLLSLILLLTILTTAAVAELAPISLGAVTSAQALRDGVEIRAGAGLVRITALRDDIVRVRVAADGNLPEDASWAVVPEAQGKSVEVKPVEDSGAVGFRTAKLDVRVEKNPLRVVVQDLSGNVICADAVGRPALFNRGGFSVTKEMNADEHFFGLGDKTGTFDRRNQAYTLWNRDAAVAEAGDPVYKSIPFFMAMRVGRTYGLFLDNTWRTWFDFGKRDRDAYSFGAEGGPLNYYIIYGPTPKEVLSGYIYLTGTPPLPPLWSLGFQQSRYSYTPEAQVREVAKRFRTDKIPGDVLYLDIDYQNRNRPFTVDSATFPNFAGLVADLKKEHFQLVLITDLHIAHLPGQNYAPYESGHAGDHFIKKADGSEFVGIVWPGPAVFPDFTRAQTREWWGVLYGEFVKDGVAGFWNDMNEPSVFNGPGFTMPLDNVHRIEEPGFKNRTAPHTEIHNVLGMENERATYEGLLKLRPEERPFVLTRATYAGGQRYGFTWTGDNSSTWSQMHLGTQMLLNLGLSGISFVGDDVGGFGYSPPADLLTRWVELGIFHPLFRDHTTKGSLPQEVWVHGPEQEAIRRRYIDMRYRLLPYIYTLAEEASRDGMPLMRPLFLEFPGQLNGSDTEFMFGPDLLVAPAAFQETLDDYAIAYPPGEWYEFWTGKKMPHSPEGPNIVEVATAVGTGEATNFGQPLMTHPVLDTLPVYVRAGSVLPMQAVIQSTEETPKGPLELRVYPGKDCNGSIYLDDGHSFNYRKGEFLRQAFSCDVSGGAMTVKFGAREGTFAPWWKEFDVVIYGWGAKSAAVKLSNGAAVKTWYDSKAQALHVLLPDVATVAELAVGRTSR